MNAASNSRLMRAVVMPHAIEEVLYALAEFAAHGVALCDAQGSCQYANLALQRISGYGLQELSAKPLEALLQIHPIASLPDSNEQRFSIRCRDGSFILVSGTRLWIGQGSEQWELLQIRPLTQPRDHQTHWLQLTRQLAAESAGIGTWDRDMVNDTCTICAVTASILGLPADCTSLPVQTWKNLILPEDQPVLVQALKDAMQSRGAIKMEFRLLHPERGLTWISLRGMLQCDEAGRPIRAVGVMMDITEVKRIEERDRQNVQEARAAAEANAKFRAFFYQKTNFATLLAVDGTVLEANRTSLTEKGFSEQQIVGRKFWQGGWWNRSRRAREQMRRACAKAAAGQIFRREMPYFMADGSERLCDVSIAPVLDDAGKIIYLAVTSTDITVRKQAEAALRASEQRFRMLTEMSPDAILVEYRGRMVYANSSALNLMGARREADLRGMLSLTRVPVEFHSQLYQKRALLAKGRQSPLPLEIQISRLNGERVDVQAMCGNVMWEGKRAIQILLRDISVIKRAQDKLRQVTERLKLALEGTGEGIWDWDVGSNHFIFSGGLNRLLAEGEVSQGPAEVWTEKIHPEDVERVIAEFQKALQEETPLFECEYRLRDREGKWRWIWARGVIVERDAEGKPLTMTGTLSDITVSKESNDLAWRHANLDALTGLPNRRFFREKLEGELARLTRSGNSLALLFIDLDGFKLVNDTCGHDAGDLLLIEVAHRIRACVRQTDTLARLGGDEFTLILGELDDLHHVEFVCQKILTTLAEPFHLRKETAYISGSIGLALYPMDALDAEDLIRKADQAMYAAKRAGKNQFHYFTKEMDDRAHFRLQIINELRKAIREQKLAVHYQPVLDLKSGKVWKAEALLRWNHPDWGDISPTQFIPLAEEAGLMQALGNWVFREAAGCCKRCNELTKHPFQMGINKSPLQFTKRGSDSNWLQFLSDLGLSGNSISIEITEGVLLRSDATVNEILQSYRDAGMELALDDFGTGYSSMAYLLKFHIDYVKIDQSFVQDLCGDKTCRAIAEAIITMAHKLGKKVIAEGIETRDQLDILLEAGCDYGQGFLFSEAVPADQLFAMIGSNKQFLTVGLSHA